MTRNELRAHLIKRRDEKINKCHEYRLHSGFKDGHDSLLEHLLDLYEDLDLATDLLHIAEHMQDDEHREREDKVYLAWRKFHDAIGVKG